MWSRFITWLESNLSACPFKAMMGFDCPGCGIQRAFIYLLKGELLNSILMYPALIPMLLLMIVLPLHLKFKFKHGAPFLMYTFILAAALIVINYIVKLCL